MTALQAYLQNSKTRKVLSKKPVEAGFSLIELVVVVAVLAVLAAIAIPGYNSVTEKGRTASAKSALANAAKECAVSRAEGITAAHTGLVDGSGLTYDGSLQGTACTASSAAVCVNNATKEIYAVDLSHGKKLGVTSIGALAPCSAGNSIAW